MLLGIPRLRSPAAMRGSTGVPSGGAQSPVSEVSPTRSTELTALSAPCNRDVIAVRVLASRSASHSAANSA